MPRLSKEQVDADVMAWWDQLQSRPQKEIKREEVTVTVNEYRYKEGSPMGTDVMARKSGIPTPPPDKIIS